LFRTGDLFEDLTGGFGLHERLGVGIVVVQVFHDGVLEFGDVLKTPPGMRFRVISAKKRSWA